MIVSWCYWLYRKPHLPLFRLLLGVSRFGRGGSEVLGLLGWGGGRGEEVEDSLMLAPHPPGWFSGARVVEKWTSSSNPHSTWGMRQGSGQPSAMEVAGWQGGPVSGSRSPGVEPLASEASPANDKELSEKLGCGAVSAGIYWLPQKKQDEFKTTNTMTKGRWVNDVSKKQQKWYEVVCQAEMQKLNLWA